MPDTQPGDPAQAAEHDAPEYRPPVDPWAGMDTAWPVWELTTPPDALPAAAAPPAPAPEPPAAPHVPPPVRPQPWVQPAPTLQSAPHAQPAPTTRSQPVRGRFPLPQPGSPAVAGAPAAAPASRRWGRKKADRSTPAGVPATASTGRPRGGIPAAPPAPVRRRRGRPRGILLLGILTAACCGFPGYQARSMWQQYPASAHLPATVSDLHLRDDAGSVRTAARLEADLLTARPLADDVFAGVYADGRGKRVTIFGVTGFQLRPGGELEAEFNRLAADHPVRDVRVQAAGERGGHVQCGTARSDDGTVVVCGWADHGSLGTAVFTRRNVDDSAELLRRMRERIITPD